MDFPRSDGHVEPQEETSSQASALKLRPVSAGADVRVGDSCRWTRPIAVFYHEGLVEWLGKHPAGMPLVYGMLTPPLSSHSMKCIERPLRAIKERFPAP